MHPLPCPIDQNKHPLNDRLALKNVGQRDIVGDRSHLSFWQFGPALSDLLKAVLIFQQSNIRVRIMEESAPAVPCNGPEGGESAKEEVHQDEAVAGADVSPKFSRP